MAVTQKQLAAKLGISQVTVSYALRGSELIADSTRQRVLLEAERQGYRLNSSARAIRTGRFGCVAVIESVDPTKSSFFGGALLGGITKALARHDIHITVAYLSDEDLTHEESIPKILREFTADGLLINYFANIPDRLVELAEKQQAPAIWINSRHPYDCVYLDDYEAARTATRHLIELGHQRIAYADYGRYRPASLEYDEAEHYSIIDRYLGYAEALGDAGLKPIDLHRERNVPRDASLADLLDHLKSDDRPSAVVCYSGAIACQCAYAAAQLGLRVPADLSLVAFEDPTLLHVGLHATSVRHGWDGVGQAAGEAIVQKIRNPRRRLPPQVMKFEFSPGQTSAPPGGALALPASRAAPVAPVELPPK